VLLLADLRFAYFRRMTHLVLDPQLLQQFQKPMHRSAGFDPHQNLAGECGIKPSHFVAIVLQRLLD
jgi:hypothetical protein